MIFSRRNFFKGLGLMVGSLGLKSLINGKDVYAEEVNNEVKSVAKNQVEVEWLGHGSVLFTSCKGVRIIIDPWISTNPKCPANYKEKGSFDKIDIILWTHGHVDHFMLTDAKDMIETYRPKVIAPWELNFFIKSEIPTANCQTFMLGNKGGQAAFDGIKITMVEAFHSAGAQLTGFNGANRFVGEAVGYILEFENGLKIYNSGDTSLMGDMKTIIGDFYKPDVAVLPIGGVFTMGPEEAAYACKLIGAKAVIPNHYGTFPVLVQSPDSFVKQVKKMVPNIKVFGVKPGVKVKV